MPYYNRPMGDYGTGGYGYPQGDPGLLSFIAKAIPKVISFFRKPVVRAVVTAGAGAAAVEAGQQLVAPAQAPPGARALVPGGAVFPGGAIPVGAPAGVRRPGVAGMVGGCPTGYHLAKDGSGRWVRNRRMNVANPRALRRSMRRVKGFEKLARKTISFTKRVRIKS